MSAVAPHLARWLALVLSTTLLASGCASLPQGEQGPTAEAMADQMLKSVDAEAWQKTGAVTWVFREDHEHLWDRTRQLDRVRWDDGDTEVFLDLTTRRGVALVDGERVSGEEADELFEEAWKMWVNDSFWLNPVVKIRDQGTTRARVTTEDEGDALLVSYASGGVTPGDSYLWFVDADGRPTAWRLWVDVIPISGARFEFGGWQQLATGAWIAAEHDALIDVDLSEVRGAATLSELVPGPDPFAILYAR